MLGRPPPYIPNNWFIRAVGSSRLPGLSPYHHTQVVVPAEYCSKWSCTVPLTVPITWFRPTCCPTDTNGWISA